MKPPRETCVGAGMLLALCALLTGCEKDSLQDDIVADGRMDLLADETYHIPANIGAGSETAFLPIRKWDMIFTGSVVEDPDDPYASVSSLLIPGTFNHVLVYVGKDADAYAYAVELNVDEIGFEDGKAVARGGIRMICLGTDRGEKLHSSGRRVLDRDHYRTRWAKSFTGTARSALLANDAALTERVAADLSAGFAYQLEFDISMSRILAGDLSVRLVDDGLADGAGCADYWTALFETYAGVCIRNARSSAAEVVDYFRNTPEGRQAYLPGEYSPLGDEDVYIGDLLDGGFALVEDDPHQFPCGGPAESGLVLPDRIFESELLAEPSL